MTSNDIPRCTITGAPKTRSLTKISQALESTFQRDYCPFISDRLQPVTHPPPVDIIPKYPCYSKPQVSTTTEAYKGTRAQAATPSNKTSCFQTHFKMGETNSTVPEGGCSTQRASFKPITEGGSTLRAEFEPKSHLTQTTGNSGNLLGTMMQGAGGGTEYNDIYRGTCAAYSELPSGATPRASGSTAKNTITGEPGGPFSRTSLSLQSTQQEDYTRPPLLHLQQEARTTAYKQKQSNIPRGDVSKIPIPPTNHQAAYGAHPPDLSPPNHSSRRAQALAQIHSSSSHPYVCDPRINPFQHSPVPHPSSPALDHLPAAGHPPMIQVDMTTSHFSQGDLNSERVEERINYSTAQKSHRPPPPGFYPKHIQGAYLRARSHFQVGCPSFQSQPQLTTMNAGYKAPTNVQHFVRSPPKDNITFRYPNTGQYQTSSGGTHQPLTGKLKNKLNPIVLHNLQQSHWHHPDLHSNSHAYCTTHRTAFKPAPFIG